ncbi:MAG TPA: HAD hydrolase-like protein [Blastocatellia bacterium]|nr:HAD hydrolase-like protein [Blastocatellia bacterium]
MIMSVRGILFDAGDTLYGPIGGRWNPRFDFEEVLLRYHPEVARVLAELQEREIRMAVVSDNWAGMELAFVDLGLRQFFDVFVVSGAMGCRKPDPRMYRAGSVRPLPGGTSHRAPEVQGHFVGIEEKSWLQLPIELSFDPPQEPDARCP